MPLETGTYITDLVTTNPAHADGLNQADSHLRLIKGSIKATFPNFTDAALNSTQAQIDGAVATLAGGVSLLAKPSAFTLDGSGLNFPDTATTRLTAGGQIVLTTHEDLSAEFAGPLTVEGPLTVSGTASVAGNLTVTGTITGPGSVPIGGMIMWMTDTLPADGNWCWANGGTLPRSGPLWALWGTTYGIGNGATTFNVINMQEVVPVGRSGMGGAGSPGLLQSWGADPKGILGRQFGADPVTLVTANLPPYTPVGAVSSFAPTVSFNAYSRASNPLGGVQPNSLTPGMSGSDTGIGQETSLPGATITPSFTGTPQGGTSTPINNVQPSRVVNFIIRIS